MKQHKLHYPILLSGEDTISKIKANRRFRSYVYDEPYNYMGSCCLKLSTKKQKLIRSDDLSDDEDDQDEMIENYEDRQCQIKEIKRGNYLFIIMKLPDNLNIKAKYIGLPPFRIGNMIRDIPDNVMLTEDNVNDYFELSHVYK